MAGPPVTNRESEQEPKPTLGESGLDAACNTTIDVLQRAGNQAYLSAQGDEVVTKNMCPTSVPPTHVTLSAKDEIVRQVDDAYAFFGEERVRNSGIGSLGSPEIDTRQPWARSVSRAMRVDVHAVTLPSERELGDVNERLIRRFEERACSSALALLVRNAQIAQSEAGRFREVSSGDPATEANQLRHAAGKLAVIQREIISRIWAIGDSYDEWSKPPGLNPTPDNMDDHLDVPNTLITIDPVIAHDLTPRYRLLKQIYGPAFPLLLHRNTDYGAIEKADPAQLERIVANTTGDVLKKIDKTRETLTQTPTKIWSLAPVVEQTKLEMGIPPGTSTPSESIIDEYKAAQDFEDEFVKMAMAALGFGLAIGSIAATFSTGGLAAPAAAEAMSSFALLSAGVNALSAIQAYADYELRHSAAGASLDPARALSNEDPSLGWLVFVIFGAVIDVGAAVVVFRNLAAAARLAQETRSLVSFEDVVRAQANVLKMQGKLAVPEEEFVRRVMRTAAAKLKKGGKADTSLIQSIEGEFAAMPKQEGAVATTSGKGLSVSEVDFESVPLTFSPMKPVSENAPLGSLLNLAADTEKVAIKPAPPFGKLKVPPSTPNAEAIPSRMQNPKHSRLEASTVTPQSGISMAGKKGTPVASTGGKGGLKGPEPIRSIGGGDRKLAPTVDTLPERSPIPERGLDNYEPNELLNFYRARRDEYPHDIGKILDDIPDGLAKTPLRDRLYALDRAIRDQHTAEANLLMGKGHLPEPERPFVTSQRANANEGSKLSSLLTDQKQLSLTGRLKGGAGLVEFDSVAFQSRVIEETKLSLFRPGKSGPQLIPVEDIRDQMMRQARFAQDWGFRVEWNVLDFESVLQADRALVNLRQFHPDLAEFIRVNHFQ